MGTLSPVSTYSYPSTTQDTSSYSLDSMAPEHIDKLPSHIIDYHINTYNTPDLSCCANKHTHNLLDTDMAIDGSIAPLQPMRQRSGYADISHLVKQKLQRSNTSMPYNYSPAEHKFTPKSVKTPPSTNSQKSDHIDNLPIPSPRRQQSGLDIIMNKLTRAFSTSNDTAECNNCAHNKLCAVHTDKQKQNALFALKQQKAHRQLPHTPTKQRAVSITEKRV